MRKGAKGASRIRREFGEGHGGETGSACAAPSAAVYDDDDDDDDNDDDDDDDDVP